MEGFAQKLNLISASTIPLFYIFTCINGCENGFQNFNFDNHLITTN